MGLAQFSLYSSADIKNTLKHCNGLSLNISWGESVLDQRVIAIEFDIRALDVEICPFLEIIGYGDHPATLALNFLPTRSYVCVERSLTDDVVAALYADSCRRL
ncbi:hypothetical protein [Natrinema longum]|uniref:Uncharacterized protein n=1 Tax=Natrinema longum TaxID=370324 RepID=A0A8A2U8S1_9EURY|nr:hypothetical protein [Natrinema longum]MBZ6493677.1 hypothetical protein [Natrinema longum]QSW84983.1 hypothetical protein J0X27_16265 [Natrinema longum]